MFPKETSAGREPRRGEAQKARDLSGVSTTHGEPGTGAAGGLLSEAIPAGAPAPPTQEAPMVCDPEAHRAFCMRCGLSDKQVIEAGCPLRQRKPQGPHDRP